jgi:hypothetical protein
MSTKVIARRVVGSLRLVGVTAAVAAGIAGFATVEAGPVPTDVVVVSAKGHLPQLPQQACDNAGDRVSGAARPFLSCRVIGDDGPS